MEYSQDAIVTIWAVSLGIAVVVVLVVGFLLFKIYTTAKEINEVVVNIWTEGKLLANNTIHIPHFLAVTNRVTGNIVANTVQLLKGSIALKSHAEECPGCPDCIFDRTKI
jgi:hypothetical protein